MEARLRRTELLLGALGISKLKESRVIVFGIGGVGSFAAEALARSGIGSLTIVDKDDIDITNLNRQLPADSSTVGQAKTEVMARRLRLLAPDMEIEAVQDFYQPGRADLFLQNKVSYVIDAVDNVAAKIDLAVECTRRGIPIISSMGAGNKLDPTRFEVADLAKTSVCPLARIMRRELKKYGIEHLKVVYSKEEPLAVFEMAENGELKRASSPGSIAFVPSVAGLIMAGEVIKDIAFDRLNEVR